MANESSVPLGDIATRQWAIGALTVVNLVATMWYYRRSIKTPVERRRENRRQSMRAMTDFEALKPRSDDYQQPEALQRLMAEEVADAAESTKKHQDMLRKKKEKKEKKEKEEERKKKKQKKEERKRERKEKEEERKRGREEERKRGRELAPSARSAVRREDGAARLLAIWRETSRTHPSCWRSMSGSDGRHQRVLKSNMSWWGPVARSDALKSLVYLQRRVHPPCALVDGDRSVLIPFPIIIGGRGEEGGASYINDEFTPL